MRRVCEVCGQRYLGGGRCVLAPVCPRSWGRRRALSIEARRHVRGDFQLVLLVYARAVWALLAVGWSPALLPEPRRRQPEAESDLD